MSIPSSAAVDRRGGGAGAVVGSLGLEVVAALVIGKKKEILAGKKIREKLEILDRFGGCAIPSLLQSFPR